VALATGPGGRARVQIATGVTVGARRPGRARRGVSRVSRGVMQEGDGDRHPETTPAAVSVGPAGVTDPAPEDRRATLIGGVEVGGPSAPVTATAPPVGMRPPAAGAPAARIAPVGPAARVPTGASMPAATRPGPPPTADLPDGATEPPVPVAISRTVGPGPTDPPEPQVEVARTAATGGVATVTGRRAVTATAVTGGRRMTTGAATVDPLVTTGVVSGVTSGATNPDRSVRSGRPGVAVPAASGTAQGSGPHNRARARPRGVSVAPTGAGPDPAATTPRTG
jgi:hypothetical protein